VDYKNSAITTASGDLFQYIGDGTGDGTGGGDLDFTGNTLTNNEPSINTGGNTDGAAFAAFAAAAIGSGAQGTAVANAPATFSGSGTTCP
jgi:hypothetical protein